ncbi:hypothetical protein HanXRQr2_Chr07g0299701 [Helianthus annuus]|uniref:Uncharacterized protein n=1 Tax=Helianthus annuus TaxID=4232 RepID=A0A9K3NFZ9_HELAN|nr:hypothetical protein HanXRQr2_Chr07g0299701 [Helianthus annuus]KAJ0728822.1 hypothetical protein HanLR1_Chr07g0246071 [Helianthus annuus]
MKKRKVLNDKKKELDEQAAAALAAKRAKLQKENPPVPSESEIDMGVFSAKHCNLLEEIYIASGSRGAKSGKAPRKIDISKITPPAFPPSRTFDLSTPPPPPREMTLVKRENKMMWRLSMLVKVVLVMRVVLVMQVILVVMVEVKVLRPRQNQVRLHLAIPSIPGVRQVLGVVLLRGYPGVLNLKIFKLGLGIPITQHVMICHMLLDGT